MKNLNAELIYGNESYYLFSCYYTGKSICIKIGKERERERERTAMYDRNDSWTITSPCGSEGKIMQMQYYRLENLDQNCHIGTKLAKLCSKGTRRRGTKFLLYSYFSSSQIQIQVIKLQALWAQTCKCREWAPCERARATPRAGSESHTPHSDSNFASPPPPPYLVSP